MAHLPVHRRFNVQEYHQMATAGILTEDDRVELLEGEIIQMPPIGSRHAACVERVSHLLRRLPGAETAVRTQNPIHIDDFSEPEPDVALVRARADFYVAAHPGPRDVLLVVEVADTSAGFDRAQKAPLYARAGIPEMWLVDLDRDRLEVRTQPGSDGYQTLRTYRRGARVAPRAMPEAEIAVDEILG